MKTRRVDEVYLTCGVMEGEPYLEHHFALLNFVFCVPCENLRNYAV